LDTLINLDGRSLQHQGIHTLALSRHFGNLDLDDPHEPDVVYFNPVGRWFVLYPGSWVKPLAIAVAILYLGVVMLGWRSGRVEAGALAAGFVVFPVAITFTTLAALGLWWLLKLPLAEAERETIGEPVAAFLIVAALVVFISIYVLIWKRAGIWSVDLVALG
jgi:hypothetical protein